MVFYTVTNEGPSHRGENDFSRILNILTHHLTEVQAKMQMQMKCIHIYDFISCMTGPPLASGFIYQEEKLGKPAYICISLQIVPCLQALVVAKY